MHEVSIAQGLLKLVEQEVKKNGLARAVRVHVRVGALSNVVPDALSFAFEAISPGTVAEGAELEIEEVSSRGRCSECDIEFEVDGAIFLCPQCGGITADVVSGKELQLVEIDAE